MSLQKIVHDAYKSLAAAHFSVKSSYQAQQVVALKKDS